MTAVIPLACWPFPVPPVVMAAIKVAKEGLCKRDGVEFMIQLAPAVPASPSRVLSFKGPTPFACDAAKLRHWDNPEELAYWIEWVIDESKPVALGFTMADWLAQTWPGTKQIATSLRYVEPGGGFFDEQERWIDLPY
ncbi:hypothetical protein [Frigoribacterium sp. CG_9.8]|uniref:hypothetical protein n=1 Tax=Frigoribacterium sp. CG_9.8 TaxID=2787733 RepID=UPI0018CA7717|nr:hypothetical protein [Frigoribacterium sp. CG_9.8]MBG6106621.1 hypothetical protein [Frigoribacterium sp. CG_9.8]